MKTKHIAPQKKSFFRSAISILKDSFSEFSNNNVLKLSAALAYYTVFSIAPMLIVVVAMCSIFFGQDAVQGQVFYEITHLVGAQTALQIQEIMKKTTLQSNNFLATIAGLATLLIGATSMFGEIQESINMIWGLKTNPKKGFVKFFLNRLISFSMVLVLGFILLVSLTLNAVLARFLEYLKHYFSDALLHSFYFFDYIVICAVIATLFAFIFKALPDAEIKWRDVWVSSLITSLLFMLGKFLIGYYLENNASISTYGAAGSIIVILLWVYYSANILYYGAVFTQVYIQHKGRHIEPSKYAVWTDQRIGEKTMLERKKTDNANKAG